MYQAKSGVKNFSLYLGGGVPQQKNFSGLNMYQAKSGVKNFSLYWDQVLPPPKKSETGYPPQNLRLGPPQKILDLGHPPQNLRPGPPRKSEAWDPLYLDLDLGPPPSKVNRQTFPSINITFPRTTYAGGKYYSVIQLEAFHRSSLADELLITKSEMWPLAVKEKKKNTFQYNEYVFCRIV